MFDFAAMLEGVKVTKHLVTIEIVKIENNTNKGSTIIRVGYSFETHELTIESFQDYQLRHFNTVNKAKIAEQLKKLINGNNFIYIRQEDTDSTYALVGLIKILRYEY